MAPEAHAKYAEHWRTVQTAFVGNPSKAVGDADRLVTQVMRERGYPVNDFDQRDRPTSRSITRTWLSTIEPLTPSTWRKSRAMVKSSSATNSVFALVLGLLAFLYLIATTLLLCAEANVVAADRLHPRALLTPFTDNVELTRADRKTYTGQAKAQRAKGFQRIDVTFDDRGAKERHQP